MVDVCQREGVRLMEAFMYRLHPSWVAVRDLVASGRIGRLVAVDSWFSYFNDDPTNIRNIAAFGGGALFDIGCYNVNLSRMLFDARAGPRRRQGRRDPATGVDVLDERHPRVRRRPGDVHLLDAGRAGSAGRHLRHGRAPSGPHPVQPAARSSDRDHADGGRRPAGRPRDRRSCASPPPTPTRSRPSDSRRRSSTTSRPRPHRRTRSQISGSSSASSRPARVTAASDDLRYGSLRRTSHEGTIH